MARQFRKQDVAIHSEGYGRNGNPAVCVKVRRVISTAKVMEKFNCSEEVANQAIEYASQSACEGFWEGIQELADYYFGEGYEAVSEGRSSGWVVVLNLPDLEGWDAIQLSKWVRFRKAVLSDVEYRMSDEQILESIDANRWAEEGAELYNLMQTTSGKVVTAGEVKAVQAAAVAELLAT